MRGLLRLASGWWAMASARRAESRPVVVLVLHYDPRGRPPVHPHVTTVRLEPAEAFELANLLLDAMNRTSRPATLQPWSSTSDANS